MTGTGDVHRPAGFGTRILYTARTRKPEAEAGLGVAFRDLDRAAIERYVAREAPLDCAGGFKSEGLGISLCESIDNTDPTALIGLPLVRLAAVLRTLGFEVP